MSGFGMGWPVALGKLVARIGFSALLVAFAVFAAASAVPVDPARALLGPMADEAEVATLRRELGMEAPFVIQFVRWVVRLMHGDFGYSPFHQRPALDVVMDLVPLSLSRLGLSMGLGVLIGALLGFQTFSARAFWRTLYSSTLAVPAFALAACSLWLAARTFGATPLSAPWLYQVLAIGIERYQQASPSPPP